MPTQSTNRLRSPLAALALCALILGIPALALSARQGAPDRGFGSGGEVTLRGDSRIRDVAVQQDGKVVAVGETGRSAGRVRLLVQRFTRAGRPDRGFRGGRPYLGTAGTAASSVAIQRNGRIVVGGSVSDGAGGAKRGLLALRLRPNGSVDRSFGGDGRSVALAGAQGRGLGVAVERSGRVIVAGGAIRDAVRDGYERVALARFQPNGRPDRSFGQRGSVVLDLGRLSVARDVALQGSKVVIAGSQRDNLQTTVALAARLRAGGGLDRSFAGNGVLIRQYAQSAAYSAFNSLVNASRGKLVLAGAATSASSGAVGFAVRLSRRGRPDRSFGGDGVSYVPAAANRDQFTQSEPYPGAYGVAIVRGKVVLAGYHDLLGLHELALWALTAGGRPDRSFGSDGHVFRQLAGEYAELGSIAAAGGKIVAGGERYRFSQPSRGLLVRYHGPR